jgi:hypothetical protein
MRSVHGSFCEYTSSERNWDLLLNPFCGSFSEGISDNDDFCGSYVGRLGQLLGIQAEVQMLATYLDIRAL